ncbi:MAG: VWA domain-containing protein [Chitinophagaceae bacterium]
MLIIAFAAGCIAIANPRKPSETVNDVRKGIDIVIALDISNSMLATDVMPNRLTKAKQLISHLISKMTDNRIALVLFAGNAYQQLPLTYDHGSANLFLTTADPGLIKVQGTAISEALHISEKTFGASTERYKSVILISDGETHDEGALLKANELATKGIMVNTIGIGSAGGAAIVDPLTKLPKKDAAGNIIVSKLNEEILHQIADTTKGKYIHLDDPSSATADILTQLSAADKKALLDTSLLSYQSFYTWLAIPMLLFLLIEIFLPDRKKLKV